VAEDGSDNGDCSCWENEELGVGVGRLGTIDKVRWMPTRAHKRGAETVPLGPATIQGMEPADQNAYLKTEIKTRDAALQAKDVELHFKDTLLQSKDDIIEAKNAVIHAIDAELQRLQAKAKRVDGGKRSGGHSRDGGRKQRTASPDLSGLNARYGSDDQAVNPDPAGPAPVPLLAQQQQVHFIHLLPPFLLLCHPILSAPPPSSGAGVRRRG